MKNHIWVVEESPIGDRDWDPLRDEHMLIVCYPTRREARDVVRQLNAYWTWSYRVRKYVPTNDKC